MDLSRPETEDALDGTETEQSAATWLASDSLARFARLLEVLADGAEDAQIVRAIDSWAFAPETFTERFMALTDRDEHTQTCHRWRDVDLSFRAADSKRRSWTRLSLLLTNGLLRASSKWTYPGPKSEWAVRTCLESCRLLVRGLTLVTLRDDPQRSEHATALALALWSEPHFWDVLRQGAVDVNYLDPWSGETFLMWMMSPLLSDLAILPHVVRHHFGQGLDIYARDRLGRTVVDRYVEANNPWADPSRNQEIRFASIRDAASQPEKHRAHVKAFLDQTASGCNLPLDLVRLVVYGYCWWPFS